MEHKYIVKAWEFIRKAAESSKGTLAYHQELQEEIILLAVWIHDKLNSESEKDANEST